MRPGRAVSSRTRTRTCRTEHLRQLLLVLLVVLVVVLLVQYGRLLCLASTTLDGSTRHGCCFYVTSTNAISGQSLGRISRRSYMHVISCRCHRVPQDPPSPHPIVDFPGSYYYGRCKYIAPSREIYFLMSAHETSFRLGLGAKCRHNNEHKGHAWRYTSIIA